MGRLQSSIGLITGTDIGGTVDQLIAISAQPRNRLLAKASEIQGQQQQIASLTATVIGVQLAGDSIGSPSLFRSKNATSSNEAALSIETGEDVVSGDYTVKTLQTAATHTVQSAQRFDTTDEALGLSGSITIQPSGFVDDQVALSDLNGGLGVQGGSIRLTDRSGQSADVDLSSARTIDDVLQAINDADVDIKATTSGGKIRLLDQTGQTASNLKVEQLGSAETAADLGLWGIDEASGSVDGKDIDLPEGATTLRGAALSQLGGGQGLGALTTLDIELADGSTANIDLSTTESLSEVVDAINDSGLDLIARINDAGNGLRIRDVSGGEGTFTISSADDTADSLGIAAATDAAIVVGEDLNLQTVTSDTKLADLNQGQGVGSGSFTITDSSGNVSAINLAVDEIETVGELVDAINALDIGVDASINDSGDGLILTDTAAGAGSLSVTDTGSGTVAELLGIAGTSEGTTLVGSESVTIEFTEDDTLDSIIEKINESGRYADAAVVTHGDGSFSLQIRGNKGGDGGRIGVNTSGLDLNLRTTAQGQDAVITLQADGGIERFLNSSDGVFEDTLSGLNLTVKDVVDEPISVNVNDNPDAVITAVKRFSDQFNKLVDKISEVTFFDSDANEVGLLFGSTETLRIQNGYSRLLSSTVRGSGDIKSLAQLGVRLGENGKLSVDESKLKDALAENPEAVEKFFINIDPDTEENTGFVGQLSRLADRFAGSEGGMLINKTVTLSSQLERTNDRVDSMNVRLEAQREQLLRNYYAMEQAISKIQSNQTYASQIQPITI